MLRDDPTVPPVLREALRQLFSLIGSKPQDLPGFELQVFGVLMTLGREILACTFSEAGGDGTPFEADGARWRLASWSNVHALTLFGTVVVKRALYRSVRNGPTRSLFSERVNLIDNLWTPAAAKVAAIAVAEMPMASAEAFLRTAGVVKASRSSLLRLAGSLSQMWEKDREGQERAVRVGTAIPMEARTVAVSLDGVMVMMVGSDKQAVKAAARAEGRADKGPSGFKEASVAVVAFYDAQGSRIATRRYGRMPEPDKATTKAWLAAELESIRQTRPDLVTMALADGSANNWSFLETLEVDQELVDFFHTAEHLHRHVSKANGASSLDTQSKLKDMRRRLLTVPGAATRVFEDMTALRESTAPAAGTEHGTAPARHGRKQPTYFDTARDRMDYPGALAMGRPIGSGVTESTCKLVVCDRLRRTGMRWSGAGGQAVMTLRALQVSDQFDIGWAQLMKANADHLRQAM